MSDDELWAARAEIDSLDERIIELLGLRFQATDKVGLLKATRRLQAVDPAREAGQALRYGELAARHGVKQELVLHVFRAVIDEVVSNHRRIREGLSS
ncbi:chorismate mutase [Pseudomonas sp. LRF_L74]|uniref:chorismate mutase n=1 Tax=Pseudomonas sp. LRF_L74 TaxID=3369422 RepID=UPI003F5E42FE